MKKYLLVIVKSVFLQIISLTFLIGLIAFAAITFPSQTPSGETIGGNFMNYFNKILVSTGTTSDGTVKKARTLVDQKCGTGKILQGFDTNGIKICLNPTSLITGLYGGYKFYIDGYTDKKMFGMGVIKNDKFYGLTYCDPETVHGSCGYASNIDCSTDWTGYNTQEECTYFYGASYIDKGYYRYKVSVNGLKINTITQEW